MPPQNFYVIQGMLDTYQSITLNSTILKSFFHFFQPLSLFSNPSLQLYSYPHNYHIKIAIGQAKIADSNIQTNNININQTTIELFTNILNIIQKNCLILMVIKDVYIFNNSHNNIGTYELVLRLDSMDINGNGDINKLHDEIINIFNQANIDIEEFYTRDYFFPFISVGCITDANLANTINNYIIKHSVNKTTFLSLVNTTLGVLCMSSLQFLYGSMKLEGKLTSIINLNITIKLLLSSAEKQYQFYKLLSKIINNILHEKIISSVCIYSLCYEIIKSYIDKFYNIFPQIKEQDLNELDKMIQLIQTKPFIAITTEWEATIEQNNIILMKFIYFLITDFSATPIFNKYFNIYVHEQKQQLYIEPKHLNKVLTTLLTRKMQQKQVFNEFLKKIIGELQAAQTNITLKTIAEEISKILKTDIEKKETQQIQPKINIILFLVLKADNDNFLIPCSELKRYLIFEIQQGNIELYNLATIIQDAPDMQKSIRRSMQLLFSNHQSSSETLMPENNQSDNDHYALHLRISTVKASIG